MKGICNNNNNMFIPNEYHHAIQRFLENCDRNLIIKAGPGCGKTTTLKYVVVKVLLLILKALGACIAFNYKNADDLKKAIENNRVNCSTVHAMLKGCFARHVRVKVESEARFDTYKKRWVPASTGKSQAIAEILMADCTASQRAAACRLVSLAKSQAIGLPGYAPIEDRSAWQKIMDSHSIDNNNDEGFDLIEFSQILMRATLKETATIDFDDMIYMALYLNLPLPNLDFLCFDEGQDCTPIQLEFLSRLAKLGTRIVIVGDPNQAINIFAGAMPKALEIAQQQLNAEVLPLPVSYRCSKVAAQLANEIFPDSIIPGPNALDGTVTTTTWGEFESTVPSLSYGDGVLARAHKYLLPLALRLMRDGKKFSYKGISDTVARMDRMLYHNKSRGGLAEIRKGIIEYQEDAEDRYATQSGKIPAWLQQAREITDCLAILLAAAENDGGNVDTVKDYLKTLLGAEKCFDGPALASGHASKGMEYNQTFLIGPLRSPLAKTDDELHAEACVEYVMLTRSKQNITKVQV